jgi:hypothetical protein
MTHIYGNPVFHNFVQLTHVTVHSHFTDMEGEDDTINFIALEAELRAAIEDDAKYWQENDAKLKAVEQRVATFDEFRLLSSLHI